MRKIGDTVRIREDLQVGDYDGILVPLYMVGYAGKTATITSIYHPTPHDTCYRLDIDEDWSWNDSMLEAPEAEDTDINAANIHEPEEEAQEPGYLFEIPPGPLQGWGGGGGITYGHGSAPAVFEIDWTLKNKLPEADAYEATVRGQIEHCWEILFSKRKEYATADPFHNFRRAADLQGITKEQALIGMMDKHVISVHDMVNEAAEGADFSADKWREKIGENINYLLILWAMVSMEGGAE